MSVFHAHSSASILLETTRGQQFLTRCIALATNHFRSRNEIQALDKQDIVGFNRIYQENFQLNVLPARDNTKVTESLYLECYLLVLLGQDQSCDVVHLYLVHALGFNDKSNRDISNSSCKGYTW